MSDTDQPTRLGYETAEQLCHVYRLLRLISAHPLKKEDRPHVRLYDDGSGGMFEWCHEFNAYDQVIDEWHNLEEALHVLSSYFKQLEKRLDLIRERRDT